MSDIVDRKAGEFAEGFLEGHTIFKRKAASPLSAEKRTDAAPPSEEALKAEAALSESTQKLASRLDALEINRARNENRHHERLRAISHSLDAALAEATAEPETVGDERDTLDRIQGNITTLKDRVGEREVQSNRALEGIRTNLNTISKRLDTAHGRNEQAFGLFEQALAKGDEEWAEGQKALNTVQRMVTEFSQYLDASENDADLSVTDLTSQMQALNARLGAMDKDRLDRERLKQDVIAEESAYRAATRTTSIDPGAEDQSILLGEDPELQRAIALVGSPLTDEADGYETEEQDLDIPRVGLIDEIETELSAYEARTGEAITALEGKVKALTGSIRQRADENKDQVAQVGATITTLQTRFTEYSQEQQHREAVARQAALEAERAAQEAAKQAEAAKLAAPERSGPMFIKRSAQRSAGLSGPAGEPAVSEADALRQAVQAPQEPQPPTGPEAGAGEDSEKRDMPPEVRGSRWRAFQRKSKPKAGFFSRSLMGLAGVGIAGLGLLGLSALPMTGTGTDQKAATGQASAPEHLSPPRAAQSLAGLRQERLILPAALSFTTQATETPLDIVNQAARAGDPLSQYVLSLAYYKGDGVEADTYEAFYWQEQAAKAGLAVAQFSLGHHYATGLFGLTDDAQSFRWFERAAKNGNARAMYNVAVAYAGGFGVSQSFEAAAHWFKRAAQYGFVDAQYNLGLLYEAGFGVPESKILAYKWFKLAAVSGDAFAKDKAAALRPRIGDAASELDSFARDFRPEQPDPIANGSFPSSAVDFIHHLDQVEAPVLAERPEIPVPQKKPALPFQLDPSQQAAAPRTENEEA